MLKHGLTTIIFSLLLVTLAALSFVTPVKAVYFIMAGLAWLLIVTIGSFSISSGYHIKAFCGNKNETRKVVALTFDDGPTASTSSILDILKRHKAPAAFFCIGKNVEKYPGVLRRMVEDGHLAGNHTYSHSPYFDLYRKAKVVHELTQTDELIEQATGRPVAYFRPPYGVTNPSIRQALKVTGHKTIGWNIRSLDGVQKDEQAILSRIKKRIKPGGIILLHDTSPHIASVLEQLFLFLQTEGYCVVSIEQLMNA